MKLQRAASVSALAMSLALVLAACNSPEVVEPPATTEAVVEPTPSRSGVPAPPEDPIPEVVWPLTGVDAEGANEDELARPALSIKIENSDAAKPQSNLQYADVVFEEQVEYGISRLVAIYHSDVPETVGPIRSMRPMDKNIMGSFGGPLIFSGAQGRFITATVNSGQKVIAQDTGGYGFYRVSSKPAPHNLHGRTGDFYKQAEGMDAPDVQWDWAYPDKESTIVQDGTKVEHVDIYASPRMQPEWKWDSGKKAWMRYEGSAAHVTDDGTQLSARNLIVLWVDVRQTGASSAGSSVPETIVIVEEGTGWAVSGNKYIPITWSKAGQFDPYIFTTEDGGEVSFQPGQTWVELIPKSGGAGKGTVEFK